jgi:hypothetical protein
VRAGQIRWTLSTRATGEWQFSFASEGMDHVRRAPNHHQTQGKIERWHQTLKNQMLLESYYLPGALKTAINAWASSPDVADDRTSPQ